MFQQRGFLVFTRLLVNLFIKYVCDTERGTHGEEVYRPPTTVLMLNCI